MKPTTNESSPNATHPPPAENAATERQLTALRSFHCDIPPEGLAYEDARAWLDVLVPKAKRHEHISEDDLAGPPLRNAATGRPSVPATPKAVATAPPEGPPKAAEAPRSLPLLAGAPVGRSDALAGLPEVATTDANGHGKWSVSLEIHASEDPAQCKRVVKVARLYLDSAEEAFALVPALEALGAKATATKGGGER